MVNKKLSDLPKKRLTVVVLLNATALILALIYRELFYESEATECIFHSLTGFYCPGCGNTRSVMALLRFDFLTSLGYNVAPLFGGIIAALGYGELLTWAAGKHRPLVPRSGWFWVVCGILFGLYYIARNFFQCLTILPVRFW